MEFQESALLTLERSSRPQGRSPRGSCSKAKVCIQGSGRQQLPSDPCFSAPERAQTYIRDGMLPRSHCHLREDEECGLLGVFTQFSVSSSGDISLRASNYTPFPGRKGFPRTGELSGKLNSRKSQENRMSGSP